MNELHRNVEAALRGFEPKYKVHDHSRLSTTIRNPQDFASALGYNIQRITKTLFLRSHDVETYAAAVCSMDRRLNLKLAARILGAKRLEAAPLRDLETMTGYAKNGMSPLGLGKDISVMVDMSLFSYVTILISGGAPGIEIELAPTDLVLISKATVEKIT